MEGYTYIFQDSEKKFLEVDDREKLFNNFRDKSLNIFNFIDNCDAPPDQDVIGITRRINGELYDNLVKNLEGRKIVGYGDNTPSYGAYNNLDSHHIMMAVILFSELKEPVNKIIEIGGGYGNFLYLNRDREFTDWSIIDLPHLGELQRWYLSQVGVDPEKYTILSAYNYPDVDTVDLVIGTHSISELSLETFEEYFKRIIKKSKYFFYCYHKWLPSYGLIERKKEMINTCFNLVCEVSSEEGRVSNSLYSLKGVQGN